MIVLWTPVHDSIKVGSGSGIRIENWRILVPVRVVLDLIRSTWTIHGYASSFRTSISENDRRQGSNRHLISRKKTTLEFLRTYDC